MSRRRFVCVSLFLLFLALPVTVHAEKPLAELFINGSPTYTPLPYEPVVLEFRFKNPDTLTPIKSFKDMHGKFMHAIIIKKDLSHFAHVHPNFDPSTGLFHIGLHLPTQNPDNQDALHAFPQAGEYFIFSEIQLSDKKMLDFRFSVTVLGEENHVETVTDSSTIEDGKYKILFDPITVEGAGGNLVLFEFQVFTQNEDGTYIPAKDLQPWMMMGAHGILLDTQAKEFPLQDIFYKHLHATDADDEAIFRFTYFDRGNLKHKKTYRFWIQFRHGGKIHTAPITFQYDSKKF